MSIQQIAARTTIVSAVRTPCEPVDIESDEGASEHHEAPLIVLLLARVVQRLAGHRRTGARVDSGSR